MSGLHGSIWSLEESGVLQDSKRVFVHPSPSLGTLEESMSRVLDLEVTQIPLLKITGPLWWSILTAQP